MALCRTKQFIKVKRKEDQQVNEHSSANQKGKENSIYPKRNDFFQTNLYQRQWLSQQTKKNKLPSNAEITLKMESNVYEKMIHKENYFVTTNRASYKAVDTKSISQPIFNDKNKVTKQQDDGYDPNVFKSIYQTDFYKKKRNHLKPQTMTKLKSNQVRFQDQMDIPQQQQQLKKSQSQPSFNQSRLIPKSMYQVSYKEKIETSSSVSSDSEYEQVKNKKVNVAAQSKQITQKKSTTDFRIKKSILVNPKNNNIIEKIINQNRY